MLHALGAALALAVAAPILAGYSARNTPPGMAAQAETATPANAPSGAEERPPAPAEPVKDPDLGDELIGRPAPAWSFDRWIRTRPLALADLRGKVVLLRWWTEGCHFCKATLPVIERLRERHGKDGLVVIGVFHPKPPRAVSDRHIVSVANRLGFSGPIALDQDWSMLGRYWLDGVPSRNWTSVSFLIDRAGAIRWVHGGGEYHPSDDPKHARCAIQYQELEQALAAALGDSAGRPN
jgi:thiol-disulfide isomerase/thioredoxin